MTLIDQEHLNNVKERERLEMERGVCCLTKLQAAWRRKEAIAEVFELRQKRQREILIRRAMETERDRFLRERQIYERQLEEFYKSMKEDIERSSKLEDIKYEDFREIQPYFKDKSIENTRLAL